MAESEKKKGRVVVFHGFSEEESRTLLRLIRENMEDGRGIAFCMSTPVNLEWKLKDLFEDVSEEHEYMIDFEEKRKKERQG